MTRRKDDKWCEPWTLQDEDETILDGELVIVVCSGGGGWREDARRIVACVNACEGTSTASLENLKKKELVSKMTIRYGPQTWPQAKNNLADDLCPKCGGKCTTVHATGKQGNHLHRRGQCSECLAEWTAVYVFRHVDQTGGDDDEVVVQPVYRIDTHAT